MHDPHSYPPAHRDLAGSDQPSTGLAGLFWAPCTDSPTTHVHRLRSGRTPEIFRLTSTFSFIVKSDLSLPPTFDPHRLITLPHLTSLHGRS